MTLCIIFTGHRRPEFITKVIRLTLEGQQLHIKRPDGGLVITLPPTVSKVIVDTDNDTDK